MRNTSTRNSNKKSRPKNKLGIPDLEHSKAAVLRSLASPDSRRGYQHAIDEFVAWYCSEPRLALNKTVVLRYPVRDFVMIPAASLNKSSFFWGTFQCKLRNAISAASSV
jgi:hypothetical protein